jgi:hypothetical protein
MPEPDDRTNGSLLSWMMILPYQTSGLDRCKAARCLGHRRVAAGLIRPPAEGLAAKLRIGAPRGGL